MIKLIESPNIENTKYENLKDRCNFLKKYLKIKLYIYLEIVDIITT